MRLRVFESFVDEQLRDKENRRILLSMSIESSEEDLLKKAGRRLGDISDLPEALRKQLNAPKMDDLEEKIIKTIKERFGGIASIDEVMVGLYRDFGYITEDRRFIANKIYRMTKSSLLESVPKRKGIVKVK